MGPKIGKVVDRDASHAFRLFDSATDVAHVNGPKAPGPPLKKAIEIRFRDLGKANIESLDVTLPLRDPL